MSFSIASIKVFTVCWFLSGSLFLFLFSIRSLIGWYHDFLITQNLFRVYFYFEFIKVVNYF